MKKNNKRMNKKKNGSGMKKLAGLIAVLWVVGCSSKEVMVPANPNYDPLPDMLNAQGSTQEGQDTLRIDQWNLDKIALAGARRLAQGSSKVKIAVIGSGVDYNHEDLKANIYINLGEAQTVEPASKSPLDFKDNDQNGYVDDIAGYDFVDHDGLPFDRSGTGTAAAGIMGAVYGNAKGIEGIAGKVSLVPVRYVDTNGNGSVEDLFDALEYVTKANVDIAYLNLVVSEFAVDDGWYSEEELADIRKSYAIKLDLLLTQLLAKGIPMVVNAGSIGQDMKTFKGIQSTMANYKNVLFVTSVNEKDMRPFIANYGMQRVAIAAPGTNLMTTLPGNKYGKESGTHLAAAHVAGAMALAYSLNQVRVTPEKLIASVLERSGGDEVESLEFETISGNRLNIEKLLKSILAK